MLPTGWLDRDDIVVERFRPERHGDNLYCANGTFWVIGNTTVVKYRRIRSLLTPPAGAKLIVLALEVPGAKKISEKRKIPAERRMDAFAGRTDTAASATDSAGAASKVRDFIGIPPDGLYAAPNAFYL